MKRSTLIFNLTWAVSHCYFPFKFQVQVEGLPNLPEKGPALLIPKHQQWWDVPLLGAHIPRPLYFLAKQELFELPLVRYWITRLGGIPVDRRSPIKSLKTFRSIIPMLKAENFLVLFPEGTYFPGTVGPGKWRLIQMILGFQQKQDLPAITFIPVGISYRAPGTGGRVSVNLRIGEPLLEKDPGRAEPFTETLLARMKHLSRL